MMAGQTIVIWVISLMTIFSLVMIFYVVVPVITIDIGDALYNYSSSQISNSATVNRGIDIGRTFFPLAIFTAIILIVLYMLVATQQTEYHSNVY